MARGINKHNALFAYLHFVGADVLGDASGFAGRHVFLADGVEQAGLAVVHVAHHGNHRGPGLQIFSGFFLGDLENHFFFEGDDADDAVEGLRQIGCCLYVQCLVDAGKYAAVQKRFQKVFGADVQLFREFADGDAFGQLDVARGARFGRRDDGRHSAAAGSRTLPRRVQLALAFHLALVRHGTLALLRLARVKRLAWLCLGRLFGKWRGQHPWTSTGGAGARTRARRRRSRTLTE